MRPPIPAVQLAEFLMVAESGDKDAPFQLGVLLDRPGCFPERPGLPVVACVPVTLQARLLLRNFYTQVIADRMLAIQFVAASAGQLRQFLSWCLCWYS